MPSIVTVRDPLGYSPLVDQTVGAPVPTGIETAYNIGPVGATQPSCFNRQQFLIHGSSFDNTWQIRYKLLADSVWTDSYQSCSILQFFPGLLIVNIGNLVGLPHGDYQFQVADDVNPWVDVPGHLRLAHDTYQPAAGFGLQSVGSVAWDYYQPWNISKFGYNASWGLVDHNAAYNGKLMMSISGLANSIPDPWSPTHPEHFDSGYIDIPGADYTTWPFSFYFLQKTSANGGFSPPGSVGSQTMYQMATRYPTHSPPWAPLDEFHTFRAFWRWDSGGQDMRLAEPNCIYQMMSNSNGISYDLGLLYLMP